MRKKNALCPIKSQTIFTKPFSREKVKYKYTIRIALCKHCIEKALSFVGIKPSDMHRVHRNRKSTEEHERSCFIENAYITHYLALDEIRNDIVYLGRTALS